MVNEKNKPEYKKTIHELFLKHYGNGNKKREKFDVTVSRKANGSKKVYLYPLYLKLRGQKKIDEEIIKEFQKVAPHMTNKYCQDKIKYYINKKIK